MKIGIKAGQYLSMADDLRYMYRQVMLLKIECMLLQSKFDKKFGYTTKSIFEYE